MTGNILDTILETKRKEVARLQQCCSLAELKAQAGDAPRPRDFHAAVTKRPSRLVNLIAEVKKASPSAGLIRPDFDPAEIARGYAAAGADAISVLTDSQYFQGSLADLRAVRQAVDLPVLRKDFIVDPCQVYEARAGGADAILLIAAALAPGELAGLMGIAAELEMTSLVEVHNADELTKVRSAVGNSLWQRGVLGVNNRDLTTFEVDIETTLRLKALVDDDLPVVSESGIKTGRDVQRLAAGGVRAILVGETLMRSGDVAAGIEELLGRPR